MDHKLECLKLASGRYMDADEIVSAAEKYWQWLNRPSQAEMVWREHLNKPITSAAAWRTKI